jgi:hypothetical protein
MARKVLNPPFSTAGPMFFRACLARLTLEPVHVINARAEINLKNFKLKISTSQINVDFPLIRTDMSSIVYTETDAEDNIDA